jgi:stage V sporulation protein B
MGMATLADPILCLFYTDTSAHMAAPLLTVLAPSSFFVCILALTNSILQGCGKEKYPVLSMLVGGGVKVATSLTLIARYGIVGAPISTLCCYFIVTVVNFIFVVKFTGIRLHFKTTFFLPLVAGVACAMTAKYVYSAGGHFLSENVACISAILLAAIVYFFVLVVFGTLRVEDILYKKRAYLRVRVRKDKKIEQRN